MVDVRGKRRGIGVRVIHRGIYDRTATTPLEFVTLEGIYKEKANSNGHDRGVRKGIRRGRKGGELEQKEVRDQSSQRSAVVALNPITLSQPTLTVE